MGQQIGDIPSGYLDKATTPADIKDSTTKPAIIDSIKTQGN